MIQATIRLLLAGMVIQASTGDAAEQVSFSRDVAPVLRINCAVCHMTGDEPGGMSLYPSAAYKSIVKVKSQGSPLPRVSPGDPLASYLLHKVQGTHLEVGGSGSQMPFAQPPLSDGDRDLLRRWIAQGAKNN